ncbi:MAG: protein BatD, partial [Ferruginibacter sp.]|nr:protein BatD [Ferruginibacter sp.]
APVPLYGNRQHKGQAGEYVTIEYLLKPKKPGRFIINAAKIFIKGNQLLSNTVTVRVNKVDIFDPFAQPVLQPEFNDYIFRTGDSLPEKVGKNMLLRLEVDKTSSYVGEPIIASYKLYTRLKSESKLTQNPSYNGFSVIDMQPPGFDDYTKGKLNGREYNVYTIRKTQIYALQPGVIDLDPAELENDVKFIKEAYAKQVPDVATMFNDFTNALFPPEAIISRMVTLKSQPVSIIVKPLPEENKPMSFKGAVGKFEITAAIKKRHFSTDEAGKLSVTITGSGNMQLLTAPDIEWPNGLESFEPKFSESLLNSTVPVSGSKTFEYSFAANDSGDFTLPGIRFSYFDPLAAVYKTIETPSILCHVFKGAGNPLSLANLAASNVQPSFLDNIFNHRWWVITFIGAVMITCLFMWLIKDKKPNRGRALPQQVTDENASMDKIFEASVMNQKNVFSQTEKCLIQDDCEGFYALLNTELRSWLATKFSLDPNLVNSNSIVVVMDKKAVPNDTVLQLQRLMEHIEWQLYTPFERSDRMNRLYQEAHELVQLINAFQLKLP